MKMASGYEYDYPAPHYLRQYGDQYYINDAATNGNGGHTATRDDDQTVLSDCMYKSPPGIFTPMNNYYSAPNSTTHDYISSPQYGHSDVYFWNGLYNNPTAVFDAPLTCTATPGDCNGYPHIHPIGHVTHNLISPTTITDLDSNATTTLYANKNDCNTRNGSSTIGVSTSNYHRTRDEDTTDRPSPDSTTNDLFDTSSSCAIIYDQKFQEMSDPKFQESTHHVTPTNNPYCLYGDSTSLTSLENGDRKTPRSDYEVNCYHHQHHPYHHHHHHHHHPHNDSHLHHQKPPAPYRTMREYFTKSRKARRNLKHIGDVPASQTSTQNNILTSTTPCYESPNGINYDSPNGINYDAVNTSSIPMSGSIIEENRTRSVGENSTFSVEANGNLPFGGLKNVPLKGRKSLSIEELGTPASTFHENPSSVDSNIGTNTTRAQSLSSADPSEEMPDKSSGSDTEENISETLRNKELTQQTFASVTLVQNQQRANPKSAKEVGRKTSTKNDKSDEVANLGNLVGAPVLYTGSSEEANFLHSMESANDTATKIKGQVSISILCCKCHCSRKPSTQHVAPSSKPSSSPPLSSLPSSSPSSSQSLDYDDDSTQEHKLTSEGRTNQSSVRHHGTDNTSLCCSVKKEGEIRTAQSSNSNSNSNISKETNKQMKPYTQHKQNDSCANRGGESENEKSHRKRDRTMLEDDVEDENRYCQRGIVIRTCGDVIKSEHDVKDEGNVVLQDDEDDLGCHLCVGCQKPVCDRYVLHVRDHGYWHADCLKCSNCQDNLSTHKSCYVKNEQVFCRNDYNILFGQSCVKCSLQFKKEQDWMRIAGQNRYHIACFLCKICKRQLGNNEKYHLVNGTDIYCTNHYRDMVSGDSSEEGQQPAKKAKRNRTSYTESQIKFLQERFLHDSNPDGNELEKIANHINLKKRVVQVWFQNNRARLKKSANNTKGSHPDNSGQTNSNGRVGTPGSQSDVALAMDWDNSLDPSVLDDQDYSSPNTTNNITTPQQHLLHQHQQQISPSGPAHYPDLYGLSGTLNPLVHGMSPGQHSSDHSGLGAGVCGPSNDQQISPEFTDVNSASFHGNDMALIPNQNGGGVNEGEASSGNSSSCSDLHKNDENNLSSSTEDAAINFDPDKQPNSLHRNSFSIEKYSDNFRRMDAMERHEQQIRQMMQYHEQQQQQQQQQHYHYQPHFLPTHMSLYPGGNFGLPYSHPYGVPPYSTSPLSHGTLENGCPSPTNLGEMPQNFLHQQQHNHQPHSYNDKDGQILEHHYQQQQQQQQQYSHQAPPSNLQASQRDKKGSTNGNNNNNNDSNINNNNKGNNKIIFGPKHQGDNITFDDQSSVVSSSFYPGKTNHSMQTHHSQPGTSPSHSHFSPAQKAASPGDFSKSDGYRSPISFGRINHHPYQFIHIAHGQRGPASGEVHHFGSAGVDSMCQRSGNDYLMSHEATNEET